MSAVRRADAGAAVAGLFARSSATGGLAGRNTPTGQPAASGVAAAGARVRQSVELTEADSAYLRSLARPVRTGQPRTLGIKFLATGVLEAAVELLRLVEVDLHGVRAGDRAELAIRARAALLDAAAQVTGEEGAE